MDQPTVSLKTLMGALLAAILIAVIVFVACILPAEYNIDPTGLGQKMGLTLLSQAKQKTQDSDSENVKEQVIEVTVPAGKGVEFKFYMAQYEKLSYEWLTDGDALYFDLHGEPEGDTSDYFESYAIATLAEMKGSVTAPFSGSHGWYWKNTGDKPISVQLFVKGQYEIIGLKP